VKRKNIIMTGGTSGFGTVTVKKILQTPDLRIILAVRNTKNIPGAETFDLDLKKSDNIHFFAKEIIKKLDYEKIDALVLNAGTNTSDINIRTSDGFETVFAVNHLAITIGTGTE
jgi:NAD(P)-dependent dehydrogenase (short-subunit alcohol dehydrogenase family)